jgi:hypothetical protein
MDPNALPQPLPTDLPGDPSLLLWIFFWFVLVITAGFAFALYYHWLRFGAIYPLAFAAMPVYGIGVLVLIGAMLSGIGSV